MSAPPMPCCQNALWTKHRGLVERTLLNCRLDGERLPDWVVRWIDWAAERTDEGWQVR